MQICAERIKLLIEQSGKSYQELENLTEIKKSSLQRYASGKTVKIPLEAIEKLSKYFDISQEYIMGWDSKNNSPEEIKLSEGEKMLVSLWRHIPEDKQQMVLDMICIALKTK